MYEIYYVFVIKLQTSRAKIFIVSFFEIVFSLGLNYKITVILFCMFFLQYGLIVLALNQSLVHK